MSTETNKAIVRRYLEGVWNEGQRDLFEEVMADDIVHHPDLGGQGLEPVKAFYDMTLNAFSDYQMTIDDEIAEGDKVVVRWTWKATHKGELMGIPATGKEVTQSGVTTFRVADAKIVELWHVAEELSLMQQLGVIPAPGQGGG